MDVLDPLWDSIVLEARKKQEDAADYTKDEPPADEEENEDTKDTGETEDTAEEDAPADDDTDADDEAETSTDYTVEDDTIEDTGDDNADATDYTADDDTDTTEDAPEEDAGTEDAPEDEGGTDDGEETGTDYTADDSEGEDGGGTDAADGAATSSDDSSSDDSASSSDVDTPKNDKLRKYYLLKDFGNLQDFIKDAMNKLTEKKRESFIDKQVDMQVVANFGKLLDAISDYMVFKFDEDDYTTAFYNYKRYTILIKMNMEILETRKEYVEKIKRAKTKKIKKN